MFCEMTFSIFDFCLSTLYQWCGQRFSAVTKFSFWVLAFGLAYSCILLLLKLCTLIVSYFDGASFQKLYEAVEQNDIISVIKILKRHPFYVNKFKHPEGYTPFMAACANAHTQMVKFMLKMGANVSLKSKCNETPFYLATFYYIQNKKCKNASCIRELYYAGADINEPGKNNMTPLQIAAIFGHTSLIKWLLYKNANLNTFPHPYVLAKSQGHHEAATLLACRMHIRSINYK